MHADVRLCGQLRPGLRVKTSSSSGWFEIFQPFDIGIEYLVGSSDTIWP